MNTVVVYMNDYNEVYVRHNATVSSLTVEATKHNAETSSHFVYKNAVLSAYIKSKNVRIVETIDAKDYDDAENIKHRKIDEYAEDYKIVNQRDTAETSSFYRELIAVDKQNAKKNPRIDDRLADKVFAEINKKYNMKSLVEKFSYEIVLQARKTLTVTEFELRFFKT